MYAGKRSNVAATVYVRMKGVDMGKPTDGIRSQTQLGSWAEFDMKFNEDAIYCSGISHGSDSTQTFINALRVQQPVEDGFSGALLPASVFFYDRWAMSDRNSIFGFYCQSRVCQGCYSDYIKQDDEWMDCLLE